MTHDTLPFSVSGKPTSHFSDLPLESQFFHSRFVDSIVSTSEANDASRTIATKITKFVARSRETRFKNLRSTEDVISSRESTEVILFIISSFILGFFLIPGRVAVGSSTERERERERQEFLDRGARVSREQRSGREREGNRESENRVCTKGERPGGRGTRLLPSAAREKDVWELSVVQKELARTAAVSDGENERTNERGKSFR